METRRPETMFELLQHEQYTPEEVARLLGIDVHVIQHAAFTGELRAQVREHHVFRLRRADVIAWCAEQSQVERERR